MLLAKLPAKDSVCEATATKWYRRRGAVAARDALLWAIFAAVVLGAAYEGLRLRQWVWTKSGPIHFQGDVANGYNWGLQINREARAKNPSLPATGRVPLTDFFRAYAGVYDAIAAQHAREPAGKEQFGLDYPPLRLLVVGLWVRHIQGEFPRAAHPEQNVILQPDHWDAQFTYPMLAVSTVSELIAAIAGFFLVWLWVRRQEQARFVRYHKALWESLDLPPEEIGNKPFAHSWKALFCGLMTGLLIWFNAAMLMDSHGWPQWDIWIIPCFLLAALLASVDWWLSAGIIIAAGALFKGQLLLGSGVLALWPLFSGRIGAFFRAIIGFGLGIGILTSVWLLHGGEAWLWTASIIIAAATAALCYRKAPWWRWYVIPAGVVAIMLPWLRAGHGEMIWIGALLCLAALGAPKLVSIRRLPYWGAGLAAVAIFIASWLYDGSYAWWRIGLGYGTHKYLFMTMGRTSNLPSLLGVRYGWKPDDIALIFQHVSSWSWLSWKIALTLRVMMWWVYGILLVGCAAGAAVHGRRKDARVLIALAAPFVICFATLCQMHERYLVWGAGITAVAAGVGLGFTLLHLVITAAGWIMIAQGMYNGNQGFWPEMHRFLQGTHPDIGWLVLLAAGILFYAAVVPRRRVRW